MHLLLGEEGREGRRPRRGLGRNIQRVGRERICRKPGQEGFLPWTDSEFICRTAQPPRSKPNLLPLPRAALQDPSLSHKPRPLFLFLR